MNIGSPRQIATGSIEESITQGGRFDMLAVLIAGADTCSIEYKCNLYSINIWIKRYPITAHGVTLAHAVDNLITELKRLAGRNE